MLGSLFDNGPPVRFEFWDSSSVGPNDSPGVVVFRSPNALRRLVWSPGELGMARAFITGELAIAGDVSGVLRVLHDHAISTRRLAPKGLIRAIAAAQHLGTLGRPLPPPLEETRLRGRRHSKARDAAAVTGHYDVGNGVYELVLVVF